MRYSDPEDGAAEQSALYRIEKGTELIDDALSLVEKRALKTVEQIINGNRLIVSRRAILELQDIACIAAGLITGESPGCVGEGRRMNVQQVDDRCRDGKPTMMRKITRSNSDLKMAAGDLLVVEFQNL
jgi:hypothetical protein